MWKYNNTSELYHHGVKGMKWGIRRDRNPDSTIRTSGVRGERSKTGQSTTRNPEASGYSIYGGKRKYSDRYRTKDGSLTDLGKQRLALKNEGRKKEKQIDYDKLDDSQKKNLVNEFVNDDIDNAKNLVDKSRQATKDLDYAVQNAPTKPRPRMDLDNMSDKELRDKISREQLERQYNDLFSQPTRAEKGKQVVRGILSAAGNVLMITSTALGIALAIKELKNGKK